MSILTYKVDILSQSILKIDFASEFGTTFDFSNPHNYDPKLEFHLYVSNSSIRDNVLIMNFKLVDDEEKTVIELMVQGKYFVREKIPEANIENVLQKEGLVNLIGFLRSSLLAITNTISSPGYFLPNVDLNVLIQNHLDSLKIKKT